MILLDTNALIWSYLEPELIGHKTIGLLSGDGHVHYSSVSIVEISIKSMLGKLPLPGGERFPGVFDEMGLIELPFTSRHADAIRRLPHSLVGHDPFDRCLLAQALAERLDFVTGDRVLLGLGEPWIVDARV